jgi:serine/threonine protein kinase
MFEQMCEAVAACHSVGVSHRDIKPENFICSMDDVDTASLSQTDRKVIVKLTDWGLGSNEVECGDFDCGSKPYMAYECRNNLGPSYRPREADIWSLGIVLLNLLFHRCPWADPSPDDPDFAHFRRDRIRFLERRFEGMGREVATYLAERVFCDDASRRVSAHEFGKWGNKLGRYMGGSQASVSDAALPMQATTARPSMAPSSRRMSLTRTESRPSPRASLAVAQLIGHSLASQPIDLPSELKAALDFDGAVDGEATPSTPLAGPLSRLSMTPAASNGHRVPPPLNLTEPSPPGSEGGHDHPSSAELSPPGVDVPPSTDADVAALIGARQRRRKRGARKTAKPAEDGDGNGAAPAAGSAATAAPSEAAHPHSAPLTERDAFISDLAVASEALARQLSKRPSAPSSLSAPALDSAIIKKPSTGLMSKVRAAVMNGNPQLEAFRQTAYERDVTLGRTSGSHIGGVVTGISSAPARLGVTATAGSQTSSTGSWASSSSWSADGAPEVRSHWASTTDRRSRVAHHHGHTATTAPSSSSASPSRLGNGSSAVVTPVSSMSSVSSKPSALASSPPPARTESPTTIEAKSSKFSKMLRAFAG